MTRTIPPVKFTMAPPAAGVDSTVLMSVPVEEIKVLKGFNVRVDLPNLEELAASIEANGFYEDKPLAGFMTADGSIVVIDGHRRLAAVTHLNEMSLDGPVVTHVPVVVKPETASLTDLTIAMIQSSTGEPLTMFEKGIAVRRLQVSGMDVPEIAKRLGVTEKTIGNYITVASAPAKARDLLLDDKVTSTQVLQAMKKPETAVERLSAMVKTAITKGRTRARPSDAVEVVKKPVPIDMETRSSMPLTVPADELKQVLVTAETPRFTVDLVKDGDVGAVVREIAKQVRAAVPQGEGDVSTVSGTITVILSFSDPEKPVKKARAKKPAPVQEPETPPTVEEAGVPDELAHAIAPSDEL